LTSDGKLKPYLFSADEVGLMPALLAGNDLEPLFYLGKQQSENHPMGKPARLRRVQPADQEEWLRLAVNKDEFGWHES
jgi:hypothetical protein